MFNYYPMKITSSTQSKNIHWKKFICTKKIPWTGSACWATGLRPLWRFLILTGLWAAVGVAWALLLGAAVVWTAWAAACLFLATGPRLRAAGGLDLTADESNPLLWAVTAAADLGPVAVGAVLGAAAASSAATAWTGLRPLPLPKSGH